jgi:hypothetical protein
MEENITLSKNSCAKLLEKNLAAGGPAFQFADGHSTRAKMIVSTGFWQELSSRASCSFNVVQIEGGIGHSGPTRRSRNLVELGRVVGIANQWRNHDTGMLSQANIDFVRYIPSSNLTSEIKRFTIRFAAEGNDIMAPNFYEEIRLS